MDTQLIDVGRRIRDSMPSTMTQRALADSAGMAPDALSRALSAKRGFTLSEITRIAHSLAVDVAWLVTGEPDPHRVNFAARHAWDPLQKETTNPGEAADQGILDGLTDLYRQAFPSSVPATQLLPATPSEIRRELGDGFVRRFAESIEDSFGIDVVRTPGLTTDYSLRIGHRGVILLNAIPSWFRSNWSLAHELAHLALGHHDDPQEDPTRHEHAANEFASQLLLPEEQIRSFPWASMTAEDLGALLWNLGVSTKALGTRLKFLRINPSDEVSDALSESTPALLRRISTALLPPHSNRRAIAERQQQAASQRYPVALVEALTTRVEAGTADPRTLAHVLDVDVDDVFDSFDIPPEETDEDIASRLLQGPAVPAESPVLTRWITHHEEP